MQHNIFVSKYRKYRHEFGGNRASLFIGLFIALFGALAGIWGCTLITDSHFDKALSATWMSLIGGMYMVLTGLWFLTRNGINPRRTIGLIVMVSGILAGTCGGMLILARDADGQSASATAVFLGGLLLHLAGVLYARKE